MNTIVLIHNDDLDSIEAHPSQAMLGITQAISAGQKSDVSLIDGNRLICNPITVMPSRHSSDPVIYIMSGNTIREVAAGSIQRDRGLRETLLEELKLIQFLPLNYKPSW